MNRYCRVDVESNSLYTKTEFDSLTGYVTANYVSEWQDKDGTRWRTITTVINLGKPDRGVYQDPDAMIGQHERWADMDDNPPGWQLAVEASVQARYAREAQLVLDLQAIFAQHGPLCVQKIRTYAEADKARVLRALRNNRDKFLYFERGVWGLHGQVWQPPKVLARSKLMHAIRKCLLEHGALSASEIAKRLGKHQPNIAHSLTVAPDWFLVVEQRPRQGQTPEARVWGLTDAGKAGAK